MQKARAEAFSDGVLAVAITLLALDLRVEADGQHTLVHQLAQNWPSFAAYLVSFFVIGVIWVNHHRRKSDGGRYGVSGWEPSPTRWRRGEPALAAADPDRDRDAGGVLHGRADADPARGGRPVVPAP